jgi:putative ABC transport system ATP-binding protein
MRCDMSSPFLEIESVVKLFDGGAIRALAGVSLSVQKGEFVAVTGPSGCGKSTLLHLVAALDRPTEGSIVVDGAPLTSTDLDRYRRHVVGLVFQLHHLLPHLTALLNIEVAMFSNGMSHPEQRAKAKELLAEVGLSAKERSIPPRLSGGERQRLAIARALANAPSLILADEPTGSLDTASVEVVLSLLQRLRNQRGVTILMVTHDAHVADAADRIVHMVDGAIVQDNDAHPSVAGTTSS